MSIPITPIAGLYWDTTDRAKLLKSGDVQADIGDTLTKWVSADGTKTMNAIGSPVLRQRPWSQHPVVELDGSSAFGMTDANLDGVTSGSVVVGARNGATAAGRVTLAAFSHANAGTGVEFCAWTTATGFGYGTMAMQWRGTSARTYCRVAQAFRIGAFCRAVWTSTGSVYKFGSTHGTSLELTGTNDGAWLGVQASFPKTNLTIGCLNQTTNQRFFTGDVAYAGFFAESDSESIATLNTHLEQQYPTKSVWLVGDSRFNNDEIVNGLETAVPVINVLEIATGGNTIAAAMAELTAYADTGSYHPDYVVVLAGANDAISASASSGAMAVAMNALLDAIESRFSSTILLIDELPSGASASSTTQKQQQLTELREFLNYQATLRNRVRLIHAYETFESRTTPNAMATAYTSDGIHPNTAGNVKFSEVVAAAIKAVEEDPGDVYAERRQLLAKQANVGPEQL